MVGGFTAFDPDGDTLTYSKGTAFPATATLDTATGFVTYTPPWSVVGTIVPIRVKVSDGTNVAEATWNVGVTDQPPSFTTVSLLPASRGQTYRQYFNATDPDADELEWLLLSGPAGSAINATTGLFTWPVPVGQPVGMVSIQLRIRETQHNATYTTQTFFVVVP